MDLIKTQLIGSVFAGGGEMGARMRAFDWSATALGPLEKWPQSLRACVRVMLGSGYPMLICWGPDYMMLYNDAYRPLIGKKASGSVRLEPFARCFPRLAGFPGTTVRPGYVARSGGQRSAGQMFTVYRNNYLEDCYFSFSYSPIRDDDAGVRGVFTTVLDITERGSKIDAEQVLRDLASRTAEARRQTDVWRVSAETFAQHRSTVPFAFLYEYLPAEHQARLASGERGNRRRLTSGGDRLYEREHLAIQYGIAGGLPRGGTGSSGVGDFYSWLAIACAKRRDTAHPPARALANPFGFLVLGGFVRAAHVRRHLPPIRSPDRRADRHRVGQRARSAKRLRMEAELERQRLAASQELLVETTRHFTRSFRSAKPEIRALKDRLQRENLALRDEVDRASMFEEIVGSSKTLQTVLSRVGKVAPTDSTVLISGETGTGKELIARAVHKRSQRSGGAFVSVNCAALAPGLISSELFGHEKGSFTGAVQRRVGRFELADGGTIFLDEVGDIPPDTQVALLRVLQERQFERVGGTQPVHVDARVIAATHRDLRTAISDGRFREDLYYRLNVFPIETPPLRERTDDILMLVEYFVQRHAKKAGKSIRTIEKKTLERLQAYNWPGNIS